MEPTFRPVRSADRTLDLLELLAAQPEGLSFAEVGAQLGLAKSSLSGLLRTLIAREYVQRAPDGKRFRLGRKVVELSAGYIGDGNLVEAASRAMQPLAEVLGETVHVAVRDGAEVVIAAVAPGRHTVQFAAVPGQRFPAHATALGKALLATLPDADVAAVLPAELAALTAQTIGSQRELARELGLIRRLGYAYEAEECDPGVHAIAAPILDSSGRGVAAIGVAIPAARLDLRTVQQIAARVTATAGGVSRAAFPHSYRRRSQPIVIAWSMASLHQQAYQIVQHTVDQVAAAFGVEVLWADARDQPARQAVDVAAFLNVRPDLLIIHAAHARHAEALFAQAAAAAIPTIAFQRPVRSDAVSFFVGGNTYEQGRMSAAYVAEQLGGSGAVAMIQGDPDNDNARNFAQGVYAELGKHRGMALIADESCRLWSRDQAHQIATRMLRTHGDQITAFLVANDDMAGGVATAIAQAGLARQPLLIGGDGDRDALERMRAGTQHGTAFQHWADLARETLSFAVRVVRNEIDRTALPYRSLFYNPPGPPVHVQDLPYVFVSRSNLAPLERFWADVFTTAPSVQAADPARAAQARLTLP